MTAYDEERLGDLLRLLPPAPVGWAEAAKELPAARAGLDELVARAEVDAALRQALVDDLEDAMDERAVHAQQTAPGGELGRLERVGVDERCLHVQLYYLTQQLTRSVMLPSQFRGDGGRKHERVPAADERVGVVVKACARLGSHTRRRAEHQGELMFEYWSGLTPPGISSASRSETE